MKMTAAKLWGLGLLCVLLLGLFSFGGVALADDKGNDKDTRAFAALLTGKEEVPPTPSPGLGLASFLLGADGSRIFYAVEFTGLTSDPLQGPPQAAHIHLGDRGENGPVVVNLCARAIQGCPSAREGVIAGTFTAADLEGPLAGRPLRDLIAAMQDERTYVNLHTTNFPTGELRGQIESRDEH